MQFIIKDYEIETIVFAHILPVNKEYVVVVFIGRRPDATTNRVVFALLKVENGDTAIADEISISSCNVLRDNTEMLLSTEYADVKFTIVDGETVEIAYTDTDYSNAAVTEHFSIKLQSV